MPERENEGKEQKEIIQINIKQSIQDTMGIQGGKEEKRLRKG